MLMGDDFYINGTNHPLRVGQKLEANNTSRLDKVTKGKIYEVAEVSEINRYGIYSFKIINDEGRKQMPVDSTFEFRRELNE